MKRNFSLQIVVNETDHNISSNKSLRNGLFTKHGQLQFFYHIVAIKNIQVRSL